MWVSEEERYREKEREREGENEGFGMNSRRVSLNGEEDLFFV